MGKDPLDFDGSDFGGFVEVISCYCSYIVQLYSPFGSAGVPV